MKRRRVSTRNDFASPLLPEHVQAVAMMVNPRDITSMAMVQLGWQSALCEPGFPRRILEHHTWWPTWLSALLKNFWPDMIHWYHILPVLEIASQGLDALLDLPGTTKLVQTLCLWAATTLCPTQTGPLLAEDTIYWTQVLRFQEWACAHGEMWFANAVWLFHVESSLPANVYFDWASTLGYDRSAEFKERIPDLIRQPNGWDRMRELVLTDDVFWPDGTDITIYLTASKTTWRRRAINMPILFELIESARHMAVDEVLERVNQRLSAFPREKWLWEPVIAILIEKLE